jgi:hypothetical protein
MKRAPVILLAALAGSTAFATTYVRVEKDGTKTYSDRPIPGGTPIEIQSAQTYSSPASPAPSGAIGVPREEQLLREMGNAFRYDSCALTPASDQTFTNPESVSVSVSLSPSLRAGDSVDLRVDGASVGGAEALSATLKPVFRGSHTITVTVKDRYGRALCNSSSTFHVFQPSLNSPTRVAPPKPRPRG